MSNCQTSQSLEGALVSRAKTKDILHSNKLNYGSAMVLCCCLCAVRLAARALWIPLAS